MALGMAKLQGRTQAHIRTTKTQTPLRGGITTTYDFLWYDRARMDCVRQRPSGGFPFVRLARLFPYICFAALVVSFPFYRPLPKAPSSMNSK